MFGKENTPLVIESCIWGHRLHDAENSMTSFLEFLCVFQRLHFPTKKDATQFTEENCILPNYTIPKRNLLRCLIFNNPFVNEEYTSNPWEEWVKRFNEDGQNQQFIYGKIPDTIGDENSPLSPSAFEKLKKAFVSNSTSDAEGFNNFRKIIALIRSSAINIDSDKRWTSLFLFPWGEHCLFADTDVKGAMDRLFFSRNGEILWLLLAHANNSNKLGHLIQEKIIDASNPFEAFCRAISEISDKSEVNITGKARLPFHSDADIDMTEFSRRRINILCDDLINIFSLPIPVPDIIYHASRIMALNMLCYFIEQANEIMLRHASSDDNSSKNSPRCILLCEMLQKSPSGIRRFSQNLFRENDTLSLSAIEVLFKAHPEHFVSEETRKTEASPYMTAFNEIENTHSTHWRRFHRAFAKECGLGTTLCTRSYRYSPSDALLESLAAVLVTEKRMLLADFLAKAADRYGIVIGPNEYEAFYPSEKIDLDRLDNKELNDNRTRLERRLSALGLFDWLSDGFVFVRNPFTA